MNIFKKSSISTKPQNAEELFKKYPNYRLCIVHTGLNEYVLLTFEEYTELIQNKRIQYQINFKSL